MHVGLPQGKWIDVCARVEIGKTVINKPVRCFVGPDSIDDIEERRLWVKTPVVDSNLGGRQV